MKTKFIILMAFMLTACVNTQQADKENPEATAASSSIATDTTASKTEITQKEPEIHSHAFCVPTKNGERWGLVNDTGELIAAPIYKKIASFLHIEGESFLAAVQKENDLYGYIDETGKECIPAQFNEARGFSEMHIARVKKDGKWGFIDSSGTIIIPTQYDSVSPMINGFASVENDGKDMFIDKTGKPMDGKTFDRLWRFSDNGRARYRKEKDGLMGIMNSSGKIIAKPKFSFIGPYNQANRAVAEIEKDDESYIGIIDENGKWIVKPTYYSTDWTIEDNLVVVKDEDFNEFVIDQNGKLILSNPSKDVELYPHCKRIVTGYDTRNFYDWEGNKLDVLSKKYDWFYYFDDFCSGLAFDDPAWGRLSADGTFTALPDEIMEPYTDSDHHIVSIYNNPYLPVLTKKRQLVYVDHDNTIAFRTEIQQQPDHDLFIVKTAAGKTLWQAKFAQGALIKQHNFFFNPQDKDLGFKESWTKDIRPVVEQLKKDKARYFELSIKNPYEVDVSNYCYAAFGTTAMLAYHYLSETDLGQYDYLWQKSPLEGKFDTIKAQLIKRYGTPLQLNEWLIDQLNELNLNSGDYGFHDETVAVWSMDGKYLTLCSYFWAGDGDTTRSLTLSLIAPKSEQDQKGTLDLDDMQTLTISDSSDDAVKELVEAIPDNVESLRVVKELVQQIHTLVQDDHPISEYDYLWTLYGLLHAYSNEHGSTEKAECLEVADIALGYLDSHGVGQWVYTEPGQFKMEVYRFAGNAAAWLRRESDPKKALTYIEAALQYAREEDTYLQDTHVRVLLNLGDKEKAYAIVKAVLEEDPDFYDFQDFLSNEDFLNWAQ